MLHIMAASMRRFCVASSLFIRGNLARPVSHNSVHSGLLLGNDSTQCRIATKLLAVPVRRWSTEETDGADTVVKKQEELSETDVTAGIAYIQSEEYIERYGSRPVFADYRRNHKGRVPPMTTRLTCVRGKEEKRRVSGNPCPICRDQNLVVHYKNVKLLEQFICPHSREIYSDARTGVCQKQYKKLQKAIAEARAYGLIPFTAPFVQYDYQQYYGKKADASVS